MAALPARRRFEAFGAESVDESAQSKQIGETADTVDKVAAIGRWKPFHWLPPAIRPCRRNQRAAAVRQNDQEVVDASPPEIADYGQRPTFESMALAPDRHSRRNIVAMGSLQLLPSGAFPIPTFSSRLHVGSSIGACCI